jgi:hypothetical protein
MTRRTHSMIIVTSVSLDPLRLFTALTLLFYQPRVYTFVVCTSLEHLYMLSLFYQPHPPLPLEVRVHHGHSVIICTSAVRKVS